MGREKRFRMWDYDNLINGAIAAIIIKNFTAGMKTRKRRQEEQEIAERRSVKLKLKIDKFINPSTILRIFNNFYVNEDYFSKDVKKYVPHESFFEFNKIVQGKIIGDFIKFTVIPLSREFELNDNYFIQRYLSFGDSKFRALAQAMMKLRDVRKHIPSLIDEFPNPEDVLKKCNPKNPIIMLHDNPHQNYDLSASSSTIFISVPYMIKNGWTNAEEYILACVENGHLCLPFLINTNDGSMYIDRVIAKLQSSTKAINNALAIKALKESESIKMSQTPQPIDNQVLMQASRRYINRNQFLKMEVFQSPFMLCSHIYEVNSEPTTEFQIKNMYGRIVEEEEFDLLQKLMPVSQNRLKRFEDKVCSYREISKYITEENTDENE